MKKVILLFLISFFAYLSTIKSQCTLLVDAGDDNTIYCGRSVDMDVLTAYSGKGTLTFKWSPFEGLNASNIENPVVRPVTTTTYKLAVSSSDGCVAYDSIKISVIPMRVYAGDDQTINCGDLLKLSSSIDESSVGTITYKWSPETGLSNANILSPLAKPDVSTTYKIIASASDGCISTDSVNITVKQLITDAGNDTLINYGDSVKLNASKYPEYFNIYSGIKPNMNTVFFTDSITGYTSGGYFDMSDFLYFPGLYKTTDGGLSWVLMKYPEGIINSMFFTDTDNGIAVGWGRVYQTSDGGLSWSSKHYYNCLYCFSSVSFANNQIGAFVGAYDTIFKTKNGGKDWDKIANYPGKYFYSISFKDTNNAYISGYNGVLLRTSDGLLNLEILNSGTTKTLYAIKYAGANTIYAAGDSGIILKSIDGGNIWKKLKSGTTNALYSISLIDTNILYITGANGTILKTTNAGLDWYKFNVSTDYDLKSVFFINKNNGFVVGGKDSKGIILKYMPGSFKYKWEPSVGLSNDSIPNPVATPSSSTIYKVTVTSPGGCYAMDSVTITVASSNPFIEGTVRYADNIKGNTLSEIKLKLKNSEGIFIDSTYTNNFGYYKFDTIPAGTYSIEASTNRDLGGVEPGDALIDNKFYLGNYNFTDAMKKKAGDVNIDNDINPIDALTINKRYIGVISKFKSGDWLFETVNDIIITNTNITRNIRALCFGDVNGSYKP